MNGSDTIQIGEAMPCVGSVAFHAGYEFVVTWQAGRRHGKTDVVDLAPVLLAHKMYRPLRDSPQMLTSVHLIDGGAAIGWGEGDVMDLAATTIERLAEESLSAVKVRQKFEVGLRP